MKRTGFIGSAAAVVTTILVFPSAAIKALASPTVATAAPALHLFEIGSSRWVFARTLAEAREYVRAVDDDPDDEMPTIHQIDDDASFTMMFAEEHVPDGVELDEACTCTPATLEKWGCDCAASDCPVTLSPRQWQMLPNLPTFMQPGKLIHEWYG